MCTCAPAAEGGGEGGTRVAKTDRRKTKEEAKSTHMKRWDYNAASERDLRPGFTERCAVLCSGCRSHLSFNVDAVFTGFQSFLGKSRDLW